MKTLARSMCALMVMLAASSVGAAGDLVVGGTITHISVRNFTGVPEAFQITVSGGSGPCANTSIQFPFTGDPDKDSRMLSLATAAYLAGKKVRVHDYATTITCDTADYIRISDS